MFFFPFSLSVCLFVCLCLFVCPSICLSVCLSVCLSLSLSLSLSFSLSLYDMIFDLSDMIEFFFTIWPKKQLKEEKQILTRGTVSSFCGKRHHLFLVNAYMETKSVVNGIIFFSSMHTWKPNCLMPNLPTYIIHVGHNSLRKGDYFYELFSDVFL